MDELDSDDVIAWLVPHRGEGFDGAVLATSMSENKSLFVAARHDLPKQREIPREERGGTELPVEYGLLHNTDSLAVRFTARSSLGAFIGCAANNHLRIPNIRGVSRYHAAITFDDKNRPILRDLGSKGGTKVTYTGEEGQRLFNFEWPLEGPSIANGKPPILNITDLVQFKVILPHRDYTSPEWMEKVRKFRLGMEDPENLFASLIIQSAQGTQLPSGQQTLSKDSRSRPMLLKKRIGEGTFGVVTYVWNMATREEYVAKRPLDKLIKSRNFSEKTWRKEAQIMHSISHEHIVAFRGASFASYPQLRFEYVPGGSLDNYTNLSTFESTQVLHQLSSALEYLHNRNPSIGHRDIKPENILVKWRGADGIYVKFADFGLSKAADILKTCCGTLLWAAPEIYLKIADPVGAAEDTYGVSVDIWSLGVVIASLACGLPVYEEEWKTKAVDWIHAVQTRVNAHYVKHGGELLYLLMDGMLIEDPNERSSADYITVKALKILQSIDNDSDDEGSATPKPSILGAQSVVESESLDENRKSDNVTGTDEGWESLDVPDPENRLSQVLETTEILPQGSTVDYLLWNAGGTERASSASSDGSEASETDTVEAQTEDPYEAEDDASFIARCLLDDEDQGDGAGEAVEAPREGGSVRKRSWPEENSSLSTLRSFTYPPSADQQCAISKGPPDHKRSRVSKDLSGRAKGIA
ncbi:MAG: hypothetical protein Q9186_004897 [Xanthomendoza sp. 1 TL-2023]